MIFFLVTSHAHGGQCVSKTDKLLQSEDNYYLSRVIRLPSREG